MIPKTLFLYWGGRDLSYLRFMTVKSFKKYNPDWQIRVFYPTHPQTGRGWTTNEHAVEYKGEDYFDKLKDYATVESLDMEELGFGNELAEVHKSGVFRLWALTKYGGVYSDFDILYFKPMVEIKERAYFHHPDGHFADGFLASKKDDKLFKFLLERLKTASTGKYQSFGPTLWGEYFGSKKPDGWNIPKSLVYACDWQDVDKLFGDYRLPDDAVGIHWFGGSDKAGQQENLLTPSNDIDSTIANLVREAE